MKLLYLSFLICLLMGCKSFTTVYVPDGQAVRLREPLRNVKVWIKTADGETVPGKVNIPEGWYCLPGD